MKKLFKKALACCLVAAMALTCFVGALTVNAENAAGTIVAGNVEVAADATSVEVPVTINADAGINAAKITVAAEGYEVSAIAVADGAAYIDEEDVNGGTFLIQANDNVAGFTAAVVNVTLAADAAVAADVVITLDEIHAATWDEAVVDLAITNGAITVADPAPVGPVLDSDIKISAHTVGVGDTFGISFRYDLSTLKAEYADFRLDIKRTSNTSTYNFTYIEDSITSYNKSKTDLMFTAYYGIELFSLTAPIEYTIHCFDADGNEIAYGETLTTTLADVAVAYHDSTTNVKVKKTIADLVMVGASALTHFTKGKTCDYATLPVPSINSDYITTELGTLAAHNSAEGKAVTLSAAVAASPYFTMRFTGNIADKAKYNYEVSYYNAMTKTTVTDTVASDTMTGNATTVFTSYKALPMYSSNADVTFKLYEDGAVVATYHYSLETYYNTVLTTSTNATLKTLVQDLAELAQSFRALRNI